MTIPFPPARQQIKDRLDAGDRALRQLMEAQHTRNLRPRDMLISTGEPHDQIYRLTSGWMARSRTLSDGRQQIIMVFLPGDLLGLKTMLLDRQPDSIQCIDRASVQALGYKKALDLAQSDPDVALRFMWQIAEDERRLHNWVIALGCGNALERIATLMLDLRARLIQAGKADGGAAFDLPMTQEQMGEHLGLTVVHVNRTLRRFREEGVLTIGNGRVHIDDIAALSEYAAPMQDIFERENTNFGGSMPQSSISLY